MKSGGGSLSRYRSGVEVTLQRISGHRDVGSTDCPGDRLYVDLPDLRSRTRAVAGAPVVRPEVTLAAAARVAYGGDVRFEGSVLSPDKTPQPAVPVRIQKRGPSGTWVTIARTTSDADGAFVASAAWTRGGLARATALESVSLPVSVGVVPALEIAADAAALLAPGLVTLRGTMRPPGTLKIVIQRRSAGRWRRVGTVSRKVRGSFAVRVRLSRTGSYRLVVTRRIDRPGGDGEADRCARRRVERRPAGGLIPRRPPLSENDSHSLVTFRGRRCSTRSPCRSSSAAIVEILLLAFAAGLLGTWIVLRGMAFFAHAVGTATFPGLVLADGLGFSATLGALGAALVMAALVGLLARRRGTGADSVTALALAATLALGVVLASDVFGSQARVDRLLFGSLLLIDGADLRLAAVAALAVAARARS